MDTAQMGDRLAAEIASKLDTTHTELWKVTSLTKRPKKKRRRADTF